MVTIFEKIINNGNLDLTQFLITVLPTIKSFELEKIIIKYGGHVMGDEDLGDLFARDIALLRQIGAHPIVVHGGGPQIDSMLDMLGIEKIFKAGLRVTNEETLRIVEMVLCGEINKKLVGLLCKNGAKSIGLSGRDGDMAIATKLYKTTIDPETNKEVALDLGLVGDVEEFNTEILDKLLKSNITPVLATIAADKNGIIYNINSDNFSSFLAATYKAKRLIFLTDAPGVLDAEGNKIRCLSISEAKALIEDGTITGGMIPKVENCISAVESGVEGVVILNGKMPHAIFYELFTDEGVGTLIVSDK